MHVVKLNVIINNNFEYIIIIKIGALCSCVMTIRMTKLFWGLAVESYDNEYFMAVTIERSGGFW